MGKYLRYVKELFFFETKKILLMLFCIIVTIFSFIFFTRFLFFPYTGLISDKPEVMIRDNRIYFSPRSLSSPAIDAGLEPDQDAILKINDIPVKGLKFFLTFLYRTRDFSPVKIEVLRNNSNILTFHIKPELMLVKIDWIFAFLLACILVLSGFIILCHLHDQKYYPFAIALFLYLLSICVKPFYYESIYSLLLMHTGNFSVWMLPVFSLYYPYPRFNKKVRISIVCFIVLFYCIFSGISCFFYLKGGQVILLQIPFFRQGISESDVWFISLAKLEKIKNIAEIGSVFIFFILLFHAYLKSRSRELKKQIEWIIAGFILAFSPYFFFEHLPFLIGNLLGESISLGNFAYIFICIFPVFFLIGVFSHIREKYSYFIPQSVYFFVSVPLVLFIFLIIAKPFHSYLMAHYSFSASLAYLFSAFLYLLVLLPVVISGMTIIKKVLYFTLYKNSLQYITSLKSENILLKEKYSHQLQYNKAILQTDKIKDLSEIVKGIYKRVRKGSRKISKSLLSVKKKYNKIISQLHDSLQLQEKKNDINTIIGDIIEENIKINELIEQINLRFLLKPSFPSWTGSDYIIQQTKTEIQKKFSKASIIIKPEAHKHLYCYASDIILALVYIISFLLETNQNRDNEIILKSCNDENKLYIKLEYLNSGINYGNLKNIFKFFVERGQKGLGLYISKVLVEKNSGSISAYYSDDGMHFILTFFLKKPNN